MATTVYEVQELILQDGSTITCKPANIKVMRKGNELLTNLGDAKDDEEGMSKLLDIVCLCTKKERPEFETKSEMENEDGTKVTKTATNYDLMEDLFDLETVFKTIELFLGVKLNDPNLVEAAAQLALLKEQEANREEQAGTNSDSQS